MRRLGPGILSLVFVAAASAVFEWAGQDSVWRGIVVYPLMPGFVAGLFFSGHGGNAPIAALFFFTVNIGFYWFLWLVVSGAIREGKSRPSK
jgi:hypothetical protein